MHRRPTCHGTHVRPCDNGSLALAVPEACAHSLTTCGALILILMQKAAAESREAIAAALQGSDMVFVTVGVSILSLCPPPRRGEDPARMLGVPCP